MTISGRASFPTMKVEDIRPAQDYLVADVNQLWKQFSVAAINHEMNKPLTDDEVSFNTVSSPDLSQLKRYPFTFVPDVIGSGKQTYFLQLKNCGFLTTSFKLTLPNEKELDLENWCDEEEMTEERLRHVSILEDLGCFELSPRAGELRPGESRVLTISYSHSSLKYGGLHVLPVHLKLSQGKQFWIDFTGTTLTDVGAPPRALPPSRSSEAVELPQNIDLFAFTAADQVFTLGSVPLGINKSELPLQRMEIVNPSAYNITYDFDMKAIHQVTHDNYNEEIFKIISPRGKVLARSSSFVEWVFSPLQAKQYEAALSVCYQVDPDSEQPQAAVAAGASRSLSSSQSRASSRAHSSRHAAAASLNTKFLAVVLRARGYDPRLPRPLAEDALHIGSSPPSRRLVQVDTLAALSQDLLDFGVVPKGFQTSRLVVLRNLGGQELEFSVDDSCSHLADMAEGVLSVFPRSGVLPPLGFVSLEVTVLANFPALLVQDRLKVVVQTLAKHVSKRAGGSRHDKLKDRIMSRGKTGASIHSEIVTSPTFSRSQYIDNVTFGEGALRSAKYPSRSVQGGGSRAGSSSSQHGQSQAFDQSFFSHSQPGSPTNATESFTQTMSTAGSGVTAGTGMHAGGVLRGPPEVHVLRLAAEVLSAEVVSAVLDLGPQRGVLDAFVPPTLPLFVPPRPDQMAEVRSTAASASAGNKQVKVVPISQREFEIRDVVGDVIGNIFRDVLGARETSEQLLTSATAVSRGLVLPAAEGPERGADLQTPEGGPVYGVYFEEVVPRLQTAFTFMQELRKLKVPYHSEDDSSVSNDKKRRTGIAQSDFIVKKRDLRSALVQHFGFSRKGELYKEVEAAMELTRNDFVAVRDFIPALPPRVVARLELGCLRLQRARDKSEKLRRQHAKKVTQDRQGAAGSPRSARAAPAPSTPLCSLPENPIQLKQRRVSGGGVNDPRDEMELAAAAASSEVQAAVTNIQKMARRGASMQAAQQQKERLHDLRARDVLLQDEFLGIAADVLRNTMSNLMQEAVHDEFQLVAEPIA